MSTYTWIAANGSWTNATNWTPAGPPLPGSDVVVNADSGDTVTFNTTVSINTLMMNIGNFSMTGGPLTVANGASLGNNLSMSGTASLILSASSVNTVSGPLSDSGQVGSVSLGPNTSLTLNGGGSALASAFTLGSSATLDFNSGTFNLGAGTTGGTGTVQVAGGTLSLGSNTVTISGNFSQNGGTVSGTGTLIVTGSTSLATDSSAGTVAVSGFSDGPNLQTGTGKTVLAGTTTVSATVQLDGGRTLENKGTLNWTGGGFALGVVAGGGTLRNDNGANFNIQTDGSVANGIGSNAFINAGTITKSFTSGITNVGVAFTSTGTVAIASGTLEFDGPRNNFTGTISGSGTVAFANSSVANLNAGLTLSVAGVSVLGSTTTLLLVTDLAYGGSLSNAGIINIGAHKLTLTGNSTLNGSFRGGTLDQSGGSLAIGVGSTINASTWTIENGASVTQSTLLTYNGSFSEVGSMLGLGGKTLTLGGSAAFTNSTADGGGSGNRLQTKGETSVAGLTLGGAAAWRNYGTVSQTGAVTMGDASGSSATIVNQASGTYNLVGDAGITLEPGGDGSFTNIGLLEKTAGTGISHVGVGTTSTGAVTVASGRLEFDSGANSFTGTVDGAGTLAFGAAGITTFLSGLSLNVANQALSGTATVALSADLTYAGVLSQGMSTTLALGTRTLTLTGTGSSLAGSVTGTGTLAFSGGSRTLDTGLSLGISNWILTNAATMSVNTALAYAGSFAASTGAAVTLNGSPLTLNGAAAFTDAKVAGNSTVTTAGTTTVSGLPTAALTIGGTGRWVNNGTVNDSGGVVLGDDSSLAVRLTNSVGASFNLTDDVGIARMGASTSSFTNSGLLAKTGGAGVSTIGVTTSSTGTITVASGQLEFDGTGNVLSGTLGGPGTLTFGNGGTSYLGAGTILGVAALSVVGTNTKLVVQADLAYAGSFSNAGVVNIGAHKLTLSGGGTLGGSIVGGGGTLDLAAGTYAVANAISSSNLIVEDGVTVSATSSVSFFGGFTAGAATFGLNGKTLNLAGPASLSDSEIDTGFLRTKAATSVAGLTLGGAVTWINYNLVEEVGSITVGDASGSTATIKNQFGATFELADDVGISPNTGGGGSFTNWGLLEKTTGSGTSVVGLSLTNGGTVVANSGTLDVIGSITGMGALDINGGATLQLDGSVASSQTVNFFFSGTGGTLALGNPATFKAPIAGFSAGDFLDLTTFDPTKTTVSFVESGSNTQGTLTVTEGSTHINFTLLGQYAATDFQTGPDTGAGTAISVRAASIDAPSSSLHYAANLNFENGQYMPAVDGFNLADIYSPAQLGELPSGVKALVYLGMTDGVTAAFQAAVTSFLGSSQVYGFYLADDPAPSATVAANLKAESDWIHAYDPAAKTFLAELNSSSNTTPQYFYTPANTDVDLYGLGAYPVQTNVPNNYDLNIIPLAVQAAELIGIPKQDLVPLYQAFGGGGYSTYILPTVTQEQQILSTWGAALPNPAFDFAYSWGTQNGTAALSDSPSLQQVFAAHNGLVTGH